MTTVRLPILGRRVGRLTVIAAAPSRRTADGRIFYYWQCQCDCGNEVVRSSAQLTFKTRGTPSCGCTRGASRRVPGWVNGKRPPEYDVWRAMRRRCTNENCEDYVYYGARGISVCDRWANFNAFIEDMGQRPTPKHSIDRIDNDKGYSPDNCRWATVIEQRHNQRRVAAAVRS